MFSAKYIGGGMNVKKLLLIILTSIIIGCVLMSGGYGLWEKKLTIRGSLKVVAPPPPPPAPTLSPEPVPVLDSGSVTGPEPSPVPDSIQENNQTDLMPFVPESEEGADEVNNIVEAPPQSNDANAEEGTGTGGGDAAETGKK